jgi:hypothetical protein
MQISIFCDNFSSRHFCDIFVAMWSVKVIKIEKCICFKSGFHFKSNKTERLIRMHIKDYSINLSIMSSIYYEFKVVNLNSKQNTRKVHHIPKPNMTWSRHL